MKKNNTLQRGIIINSSILVLIPILFFAIVSVIFFQRTFRELSNEKNQVIAESLANQYENMMQGPMDLAKHVMYVFELESEEEDKHVVDSLSAIVESYEYIMAVDFVNDEGIVEYSSNPEDVGEVRKGEDFYRYQVNSANDYYWSVPIVSQSTRKLTHFLVYYQEDIGYLVVHIDLSTLGQKAIRFVEDQAVIGLNKEKYSNLTIEIVDEYGRFIFHSTDYDQVQFRLLDDNIDTIKTVVGDEEKKFEILSFEDKQQMMTVYRLNLLGNDGNQLFDWYVVVYQPVDDVYGELNSLLLGLAISLLLSIVIAVLYMFRYTRRIGSFVNLMSQAMKSAVSSNYESELPDLHYADLNEVGDQFSYMMGDIKERDHRLYEMAYKDKLTNLGSRQALNDSLILDSKHGHTDNLTLVFLDIMDFKVINDLYGHDIGDKVLIFIANYLREAFETTDVRVCRTGPDEFSLTFRQYLDRDEVKVYLDPMINNFEDGIFFEDRLIRCSISVGIACYPLHTNDVNKLIQLGDIVLAEAKSSSTGNVLMYDEAMHERMAKRSKIDSQLRTALSQNLFELHYQPVIDLKEQKIKGFEALIRMRNINNELISPFHFIPVAEESGLIIEIGEWILAEAIRTLKQLDQDIETSYFMNINISTIQMQSPDFSKRVMEIIDSSNVNKDQLTFEVTESVFIDSQESAYETLMELNKYGIRFALDDFGTGYSSLSYLTNMPFKVLKVDRSFIADVETIEAKRNMLESIIMMGHKLNFNIVAEGVETQEQLKICESFGCDNIQGYLYSRPLPIKQLKVYIKTFMGKS